MIALPSGREPESLSKSGRAAYISMMSSEALIGNGKRVMGHTSGRLRGGKECGPNPTDRAKPGIKDHLLCDGRGVPLSVVVTAANVNDSPMLPALLNNCVVVRRQASSAQPQHLCLDAAYDNAPAHRVLLIETYQGHIAPKRGRDQSLPRHESGKARRWVVEVVHAWHDRFRRLVVNWEKTTESRYAFLCLANALIAYRM